MNRKTIALPGRHDVDITDIQPLVDSPLFQRLRYRAQLGVSSLIFPCAQHTRFAHSLGSYALTCERTDLWQRYGYISMLQALNIKMASLLHDIGHGPFSHATEPLCPKNHKVHGLELIRELAPIIAACGAGTKQVEKLLRHEDPLHCCFSDRPVGTDKLDYLIGDARHTTEAISPRLGDLINHVHYLDGQLAVDIKIVPEVHQLIEAYLYAHERVYLRKSAVITQAFLQQIIAREMAAPASQLTPEKLANMTDLELASELFHSSVPNTAILFDRLLYRRWPKMALRITPKGTMPPDRLAGKSIAIFTLPLDELRAFDRYQDRATAASLESAIARIADIPPDTVLLVPIVSLDRFMPADISVCDSGEIIGNLNDAGPPYQSYVSAVLQRYAAVRVCVQQEYRHVVAAPATARRIFDCLREHTSQEP